MSNCAEEDVVYEVLEQAEEEAKLKNRLQIVSEQWEARRLQCIGIDQVCYHPIGFRELTISGANSSCDRRDQH